MPMMDRVKPKKPAAPPVRAACTCGSLRKASRRVSQFYDQFSILSEVERGSIAGPVVMSELASAMVMDRSTLGHNLRPLERDNLVVLRQARQDRRKRYVELTAKGKSLLPRAHRLWRGAENRFERIFGKAPAAELRAVLMNIANNRELDSQSPR